MLGDDHFDKFAHGAFGLPDLLADPVVQFQRDLTGNAFGFHAPIAPYSSVFCRV